MCNLISKYIKDLAEEVKQVKNDLSRGVRVLEPFAMFKWKGAIRRFFAGNKKQVDRKQ